MTDKRTEERMETHACDLIDRQAAIENSFEVYTKEYGWCEVVGVDAISELPSAQPEPKWIPCSERLPEDSRDVLLQTISGVVGVGCYISSPSQWVQWYSGGGLAVEVIAWMPLPKPYVERRTDE